MGLNRYNIIKELADQYNWQQGAELGVWVGVTTFYLMQYTKLKLYAIDCWEEQPNNPEYHWQYNEKPKWSGGDTFMPWDHTKNEKDFREKAKEWSDRLTIIRGYTLDVVDQIPDKSLDFVFHDSDHSYPFVVNEIKAYLPKLKDGGFCMGDDFEWDPVKQSVKEMFGTNHTVKGKGVWYKQI